MIKDKNVSDINLRAHREDLSFVFLPFSGTQYKDKRSIFYTRNVK